MKFRNWNIDQKNAPKKGRFFLHHFSSNDMEKGIKDLSLLPSINS